MSLLSQAPRRSFRVEHGTAPLSNPQLTLTLSTKRILWIPIANVEKHRTRRRRQDLGRGNGWRPAKLNPKHRGHFALLCGRKSARERYRSSVRRTKELITSAQTQVGTGAQRGTIVDFGRKPSTLVARPAAMAAEGIVSIQELQQKKKKPRWRY